MITEDYCSYEVSKLLNEKGFINGMCDTIIGRDGTKYDIKLYDYVDEEITSCPTHQMAMKWLREKYNLFFSIGFGNDDKGDFLYMVDIYDLTNDSINGRYKPIIEADDYLKYNPKTYEEAVEAALKYSLENLI